MHLARFLRLRGARLATLLDSLGTGPIDFSTRKRLRAFDPGSVTAVV